ncbi:MAG: sel1 repeat family protein [Polyangiaceae bacterium]|nr:sel1 repeat family protein [Polyangiaceae bacterium]
MVDPGVNAGGCCYSLNDPTFTRAVQPQEGLVDLEFDNECNAWGVTIISGTDFVRKITPAGQVSAVPGVTNLDMGEVAVLTGKEGFFGGGSGDVALTYTCCATCGCDISATGNPQGAALLDPETGELPMKIPSDVYTDGKGPFGNKLMDNGPQGLSWGLDRVLYLGNVKVNGEYAALDLLQGVSTTVVTLPERIYASTPFDAERMAVATESGKIFLVPTLGQAFAPVELLTLPSPATSLQRDPWSGRLYAELSSLDIVAIKADGSEVVTVAIAPQIGRIALAPDGFVYHIPAYGVPVEIVRFPMLGTLLSRCSIGIFCIHKKAMRSVRLPVHLGVDALWRKAGVAASLLPGVTLTATGLLAGFPGPGGLQVLVGGVLLLVAPGMAWLAWRARPSDALLDSEGVRIEGGAHDGLLVRWQDMARVKSGWADDMNVTHRLEVALRSGQTLVLAEATDTAEIASLRSLHETIRVHLGEAAEPPPSRADLALCRGCGAPLVPGDQPTVRCRACGAENPVAPALRERVAAQRAADQAQRSTAQAVEQLLQQPGVQGSRGALLLAALASAAAWALVLVSFRAAGLPSLDWFLIGSGFFSGWSLTFAAYSFARIALARRRALLVLSTTFGARPPSRQGEGPGCRNCGGPLPTDSGAVARCAYCGAQSVLGIDVRPLLERVRGHQGSIEDLLAAQQAERSTWLKLGLAASAAALLGGAWLGIQLSVTREFAEDLRRCEAGSGAACSKVALSYFNGSAVKEDRARAFKYREVACGKKIAEACGDMAAAYRFGWGVPQDRSKARASYEQACKLGHQESCKDLEGLD